MSHAAPTPAWGAAPTPQHEPAPVLDGGLAALRAAFDAMADEYDDLRAPWYRHSTAVIDGVLVRELAPVAGGGAALDLGCGTGIQSLTLARLGYRVVGVDLSRRLLAIARSKLAAAGGPTAAFVEGDAVRIPAQDAAFDAVSCCGPVLSLIPDWRGALAEIVRCLRPGGRLLLEVEGKWNADVLWELLSALFGNALGYDQPLRVALRQLLPPWTRGHRLAYSLKLESGGEVGLPLKLFTPSELAGELRRAGLAVERRWGIHALTNLFPSTLLHRPGGGRLRTRAFEWLAAAERRVGMRWPVNALGCSLLVLARRL